MSAHVNSGITWGGAVVAAAESVVAYLSADAVRQWVGIAVSVALGALGLYIHVAEKRERARIRTEDEHRRAEDDRRRAEFDARIEAARVAVLEQETRERVR